MTELFAFSQWWKGSQEKHTKKKKNYPWISCRRQSWDNNSEYIKTEWKSSTAFNFMGTNTQFWRQHVILLLLPLAAVLEHYKRDSI